MLPRAEVPEEKRPAPDEAADSSDSAAVWHTVFYFHVFHVSFFWVCEILLYCHEVQKEMTSSGGLQPRTPTATPTCGATGCSPCSGPWATRCRWPPGRWGRGPPWGLRERCSGQSLIILGRNCFCLFWSLGVEGSSSCNRDSSSYCACNATSILTALCGHGFFSAV